MTREQIEKKGMDYFGFTGKSNDIGSQVRELLYKAFVEGAQWRINSVWHDANETPQHSGLLIAICKDEKALLCGPNNSNWETTVKIFHIVRWAYVDDLTPERKEETNGGR